MHSPSGMDLAGLIGLLVAVPAVAYLGQSGRRHTGAARRAHLLLAAGGAIATGAALAGLVTALITGHHDVPGHTRALATAVAVGMGIGTLTLLAGTVALPGAASSPAAAVRHLLDGLVIAAAVWFVGWVLISRPTRILGDATPNRCLAILLPALLMVLALGLTAVLTLHAHRPRRHTVRVAAGVTVVAAGANVLAIGICRENEGFTLASGLLLTAGLTLVAWAVRAADRPVEVSGDVLERGAAYVVMPMVAMIVALGYHLARGGAMDVLGYLGVSVVGLALVARQYLALGDVRRYTMRLRQSEAHFRELAHTDPLTGLANRRGLQEALRDEPSKAALIGIDMDGFKSVNDLRGHDVGDAVLAEVGARLRRNLLAGDVAARLGGDEFAVLMRGDTDEAVLAAHRLLAVLGEPYEVDGGSIFLSASLGVAATGELLHDADLALRYAKQRGKNRVESYQHEYDELLRRRGILTGELRHAIDRNQLHLVFQPVVALPSMRPLGGEALLRWTHPELGRVAPVEFIPVAEESGLINRIGAWVLEQACKQLAEWLANGHDIWLSVNLSPKELHNSDYAAQVADVLAEYGVPPQRLVLEVTEHAVATDMEELVRRLAELRETGVRIALDDFGAGYSSLTQLRTLPVDILKIDHALVAEPESRTGTAAPLVDVVVRLGHRLGLEVLAEGIGTPAQREVVEEAGCRLGQGSLFGWGVPAEHFESRLLSSRPSGARPLPQPRRKSSSDAPARSQVVRLGPGMRQVRALLPSDPDFATAARDQNMGSVDSGREMGQG
ncbi:bifunctional diguanylate cyclase/phosphodiesterase [Actinoplanes sp. NEAU-A12]|uniref:Bifunctional diguanylate cyclase/phosphodiesterase n=1 Tax=Actinoplanes sandaracinus TaxID=3045177 RepID=A0ABT6WDE8_9ACTN|nr:bifunctional diguanylate cyclase/phosphodiesterase [Actinoplanes sandaracinus]MDI6097728.1 bifunctional diguanylate cyclase/phosphodiesterase [Actinoplanes sandaracinus]